MPSACDYSIARPSPAALTQAGIEGVVRYATRFGFDQAEYESLLAVGLKVAVVMEEGSQPALRGAGGGTADAEAAEASVGGFYDPAAVIYYVAEDPNILPTTDWPTVVAYFQAVGAVNPSRPLGAYGSQALVNYLQSLGLATYGWGVAPWSVDATGLHLMQELGGVPPALSGMIDMDTICQDDWGQAPRPTPLPTGMDMAKPCVFNTPDKNEHVFFVDSAGTLHHYTWTQATNKWGADVPLGGGWEPNGELATAVDTDNHCQVWGMRANGSVAQVYFNGSAWVTQPL